MHFAARAGRRSDGRRSAPGRRAAQGELEPFGRPWRLIYLGDPLYKVRSAVRAAVRLSPRMGDDLTFYANWPTLELAIPGSTPSSAREVADEMLLNWCQDAAIGELVSTRPPAGRTASIAGPRRLDWRSVLRRIRRDRLDRAFRLVYDDLLIDALRESGAFDEMQSRLALIPPDERRPRVWQALETGAMARLAQAGCRTGTPSRVSRRPSTSGTRSSASPGRPARSSPAQLTERVSALVRPIPLTEDSLARSTP